MHVIREKRHRLPQSEYKGQISVAFTLCLRNQGQGLNRAEISETFSGILASESARAECIVPVYCFMPDHQHLIVTGSGPDSDAWKAVVGYKQKTGYWMTRNVKDMDWQKDFYDHIIRTDEDVAAQVRYILDNPVRKGLVSCWRDYPFKGAIGCRLEDVLVGIM